MREAGGSRPSRSLTSRTSAGFARETKTPSAPSSRHDPELLRSRGRLSWWLTGWAASRAET